MDYIAAKSHMLQYEINNLQEKQKMEWKKLEFVTDEDYETTDNILSRISKLQSIKIYECKFRRHSFPLTTPYMQSLVHLHIEKCGLKHVDERLFQLPLLREVNLSHNLGISFQKVDDDDVKNSGIVKLILWSCGLKELPTFVKSMKNLELINVTDNQITFIPLWIKDMEILVDLRLSRNKVRMFPVELIDWLESPSKHMDLENNPWWMPPEHIWCFGYHQVVHYLKMKGNKNMNKLF